MSRDGARVSQRALGTAAPALAMRPGLLPRISGGNVVREVLFQPTLADDAGEGVGNGAVRSNKVGGWRAGDPVAVRHLTRSVHQERIRQPEAVDEVGNLRVTFLDTDRKNFEPLILVTVVGRP